MTIRLSATTEALLQAAAVRQHNDSDTLVNELLLEALRPKKRDLRNFATWTEEEATEFNARIEEMFGQIDDSHARID
jgi:hypothetical protein